MLFTLSLLYAADSGEAWATRTENAAVRLRAAADQLAETASAIGSSGRAQQFAVLHSDADELVNRANQLVIWANQAPSFSPEPPPAKPEHPRTKPRPR